MANDLTGDFDVVAEISVLAADRALAAMHRAERLLHSMTVRVDDIAPRRFPLPVIVGWLDGFGEVAVNQRQVVKRNPTVGAAAASNPVLANLDVLVNSGFNLNPQITPSNLQGVAQLQLDPPTIQVPDKSGSSLSVRMAVRARYLPDPNTSPAAQFVHGLLVLTAPVSQVASGSVNVIDINISGADVDVAFNIAYSSSPLSAADTAGINQLIRNALRTSFQPSNSKLPSNINYLQFKTFSGSPSSVGVLMNLIGSGTSKGHPSTVNNVFLSSADDFAFAVGSDYIIQQIMQYMNFTIPSTSFYSYTFTINTPTIQLQTGKIVLSVSGHAHSEYLPDFDFTLSQAFTLNLVASTPGGPLDTAELAVSGDFGHDVTGLYWPFDYIVNDFLGWALGPFRSQRDANVAAHEQQVRSMFSLNKLLGGFLNSLLNPAQTQPVTTPQQNVSFTLAYTAVDIQPAGIILHGSLSVSPWPAGVVQYQPIPSASKPVNLGSVITAPQGPDYSALKTWIPGGGIIEYDWSYRGQSAPFHTDQNKFVLLGSTGIAVNEPVEFSAVVSGVLSGYEPLCLTVKGTRLSSSGPVVSQPVTATVCGYNSFPVINGGNLTVEGAIPMVVLTNVSADGSLQVVGHAPALSHIDQSGNFTPNVVAHFADDTSSANLAFLIDAVKESGRKDAATAVLGLLTQEQLTKTRHTPGVIYGDRHGGGWERAFGVKNAKRPLTLVLTPGGKVVWQQEGPIDSKTLAAALKKNLAKGGHANRALLSTNLRSGHRAPNFVFGLSEGNGLTLRKLEGRQVVLAFWRSTSKPSYEAIRDLQEALAKAPAPGQGPIVLAINDGESVEVAKKAAATHKLTATLVTDPQRQISSAYGIGMWPTIVSIDASGAVSGIRQGRSVKAPTVPSTGTAGTAPQKK
jgi:peroxiredoxin